MGIPSFSPMYDDKWSLQIVGPILEGFTVEEVMHRVLARPFWPLQMSAMRAKISFTDLGMPGYETSIVRDGLRIQWCPVHHPGGCVAYRIDEPATGQSFVFATDIEWSESSPKEQNAFVHLCREPTPVQMLMFDGQYDPDDRRPFRGWGHSTWQDAAEVARRTDIAKLLVIHHSPLKDDRALSNAERELQKVLPTAKFARQGQVLEL
jgi:ribonuclease BN (tRNA processing enzyme)